MQEIIDFLKKEQDEKYQAFSKKLIPDTNLKIIGVQTPKLKKLAKYLHLNHKSCKFIKHKHEYFEETLLHGFLLGYEKDVNQLFLNLNAFIPQIDN